MNAQTNFSEYLGTDGAFSRKHTIRVGRTKYVVQIALSKLCDKPKIVSISKMKSDDDVVLLSPVYLFESQGWLIKSIYRELRNGYWQKVKAERNSKNEYMAGLKQSGQFRKDLCRGRRF